MDLNFTGQISEDILRTMEHLDQIPPAAFIITVDFQTFDERVEFGELGRRIML